MKCYFLPCLFLLLFPVASDAQSGRTVLKAVSVQPEQYFYLNGGLKAALGGTSREVLAVNLPENTVSWNYIISTSQSGKPAPALHAISQIMTLTGPTGIIAGTVIEALSVPPGSASCDVFLMDRNNALLFERKTDLQGRPFQYYSNASRFHLNQGNITIDNPRSGNWYLGIRNPEEMNGINVSIEIIATVETTPETTQEEKQAVVYGTLGWQALERGDYDQSLQFSNTALELDSTLAYIWFNKGLALLVKNNGNDAVQAYAQGISLSNQSEQSRQLLKAAMNDIRQYMDKIPQKTLAADILTLLSEKLP